MSIRETREEYGDIRIPDIVAKMAGVNLKDTIRVMLAMKMVGTHIDATLMEMTEPGELSSVRPSSANFTACEQLYSDMVKNSHVERQLTRLNAFRK